MIHSSRPLVGCCRRVLVTASVEAGRPCDCDCPFFEEQQQLDLSAVKLPRELAVDSPAAPREAHRSGAMSSNTLACWPRSIARGAHHFYRDVSTTQSCGEKTCPPRTTGHRPDAHPRSIRGWFTTARAGPAASQRFIGRSAASRREPFLRSSTGS